MIGKRYIDADDIIQEIRHYFGELIRQSPTIETEDGEVLDLVVVNPLLEHNKAIQNIIKGLPTVDAVEVVRCKDCRFVGTDATCCLVCNRNGMGLRPFHVYHDDFCSYAERREG